MRICHYCGNQGHIQINSTNLSTANISTSNLLATATSNISTTATNYLSTPTNSNTTPEPSSNDIRQLSIQSHSKLEISDGCSLTDSPFARPTIKITHPEFGYQSRPKPKFPTLFKSLESNQHVPTNTILLATISSDKSLAAIFPFELEKNTPILLFSGATLEEKLITAMYTDARIDGHPIKLILDIDRAASTRIITADRATKTPIGEIDEFLFEVNSIVTPIKSKLTSSWEWEKDKENKGKEKEKEKETTQTITTYNTYTIPQQSTYRQPKLICVDCGKKLLSMSTCCGNDEEYHTATKFYCRPCLLECFG
ncbi:hypothetical protein G9A89_010535 [Geosiphon pyriformis]|nr:hypothetical protein G9A89_010535 [Geosiphon pyriformis]